MPENPGQQAGYRVDNQSRRKLAAGQDEIAYRELAVAEQISHSFIDTFIAPTDQHNAFQCRQSARRGLSEAPAERRTTDSRVRSR